MIREFLFAANDPEGNPVSDTVVASDAADAKSQLARMGYRDVRMQTGDLVHFKAPEHFDASVAAVMMEIHSDSLAVAVLKIYRARWIDFLPGVLVLGWALWSGRSPWWGLGLLVAGMIWTTYKALPTVLYTQVLWARVQCKYERGLRYVAWLRMLSKTNETLAVACGAERSNMIAGLGRLDEALALFAPYADRVAHVTYLTHVAAIYESAGRRDAMIDVQRQQLAARGNCKEMCIDLAFSLVRYTEHYDEARTLVAQIHPSQCADLPASGLRVVRALLDQADGRHAEALSALQAEHAVMSRYTSPLMVAMSTELRAYIALSVKALGKKDAAAAMWRELLPFMQLHGNTLLIARYDRLA